MSDEAANQDTKKQQKKTKVQRRPWKSLKK